MREQLIRYLLGEMDEDERREMRALLQDNPELQSELSRLRTCFAEHQDSEELPAPRSLAERTADRVSNSDEFELEAMTSGAKPFRPAGDAPIGEPSGGILGWSLADLTVAFGVMLAVSMLVFPALRDSRESTRRVGCLDHQRQLGVLLFLRARDHGGFVPRVYPGQNAGNFAAQLIREGYVKPEDLAVILVCPAAPLADEIRHGRLKLPQPQQELLRSMSSAELKPVTANMSPFFGYRMPQKIGDDYVYAPINSPMHFGIDPLCGDTLGDGLASTSSNHGGNIVQILCWDGSARTFAASALPQLRDDLFHNDLGMVAAGLGWHDAVLAPSNAEPGLLMPHDR
jgi:hypothetical protein